MTDDSRRGEEWARAELGKGRPISFPAEWSEAERTVSGSWLVKAMLAWPVAAPPVPFVLENAVVESAVDLQGASVGAELCLRDCHLRGALEAREATFARRIRFVRCVFDEAVTFDSCSAKHVMFAEGFELARGAIAPGSTFHKTASFIASTIAGSLCLDGARFLDEERSLSLNDASVGASVFLQRAEFFGRVVFAALKADGELICFGTRFSGKGKLIDFNSVHVKSHALFDDATFLGPATFEYGLFDAILGFNGAWFIDPMGAVDFRGMTVGKTAVLQDTIFGGSVNLYQASIGGSLRCERAEFLNETSALYAAAIKVGGECSLVGAAMYGPATFTLGNFEGGLYASKVSFAGKDAAVDFTQCHVGGLADFTNATCRGPFQFWGARIDGNADFGRATFQRAVGFNATVFGSYARFRNVRCDASVNLQLVHVAGVLDFTGAHLAGGLDLTAARVDESLVFYMESGNERRGAVLEATLNMTGVRVGSMIQLESAEVRGTATFLGMTAGQELQFQRAKFGAAALFNLVECGSVALFHETQFGGDVSFNKASFGGKTGFLGTVFSGVARFHATRFRDEVEFRATDVTAPANRLVFRKKAEFGHASFAALATFWGVQFMDTADFSKCRFESRVFFERVDFSGPLLPLAAGAANDSVQFVEADFGSQAIFIECTAGSRVAFYGARSHHTLVLDVSCGFTGNLDFTNSRLTILRIANTTRVGNALRPPPADFSFLGSISLAGCTYQQLMPAVLDREALWLQFLRSLRPRDHVSFDRQPYLQFERICRESGEDKLADQVYFDLRRADGATERRPLFWLWNWVERLLFGYGVRPFRLIVAFVVAWLGGAIVISALRGFKTGWPDLWSDVASSYIYLVPGVEKLVHAKPASVSIPESLFSVALFVFGWALLALIAHRFFKGLKR